MKRLIFACDGTWNRVDADHPTNVLKLAMAVPRTAEDRTVQNVFYIEGVGTGRGTHALSKKRDRAFGGMFGHGLLENIESAYRQLIFNYEPGDEIYIFGFSRGAYTARSFAGLIRSCGIIGRDHVHRIPEAIARYQKRDAEGHPDTPDNCKFRWECNPALVTSAKDREWRVRNAPEGTPEPHELKITYMGIWDTVGAMGVPDFLKISHLFNAKYKFHDAKLSSSVSAARHALALDERRSTFPATKWKNLEILNHGRPLDTYGNPPYMQQWFSGDHGSVGGGGDIPSLSDGAFLWIVEGAMAQGLEIDQRFLEAAEAAADFKGPLYNQSKREFSFTSFAMSLFKKDRSGPDLACDVSRPTRQRWNADNDLLPNREAYRPASLDKVKTELGGDTR